MTQIQAVSKRTVLTTTIVSSYHTDVCYKQYTVSLIGQLFPKARAEVIRLLFTDPDRSLHLRELARLSGLAVGTIQTKVAKLRKAGLLEERRDGNRLYFRANVRHPIFAELRGIAIKTTGLRALLLEASTALKVSAWLLSTAR